VFDRDSGAHPVDAVAASCAVPGAWPPVTIGGRRYMDGGIGSTINLAVADDCDAAVVLVPAGVSAPSSFGARPAAEIAAFGGAALSVFADDESLAAFGSNPLDPRCRTAAALAGRAQGRREAAAVAAFLVRSQARRSRARRVATDVLVAIASAAERDAAGRHRGLGSG